MRLSLCLIARNEQHNLARALDSFVGLCDEIIVTDTGSSDQTVDVARRHGARVLTFPWCDDFAAARNFCIQHAGSEWIFWLDADEALVPGCRVLLQQCLDRKDAAGWFVLRQDLSRADRTDEFTEMWQLRLFRRDERLRFVGRCHPQFQPSLLKLAMADGRKVLPSEIRLRHWGYVDTLKPAKLRRAARLLQLELADRPGQLYYEIELARTLLALGESGPGERMLGIATEHLLRHRSDLHAPTPVAEALLEQLLANTEGVTATGSPSQQVIWELAERWFPASVPLLWAMSCRLFDAGDFEKSAQLLERLVHLGRSGTYQKFISFDPRLIHEDAQLNLSACYIRLARLDEAEAILNTLTGATRRAEAMQNLGVIAHLRTLERESRRA